MLDQATAAPVIATTDSAVSDTLPVVQAVEVVGPKSTGATSFRVKVTATRSTYRFEPARYPREPRFWCVAVSRCSATGEPDPSEPAWIGEAGLSWDEIGPVMNEIRADVVAWLEAPNRRDVYNWMMKPA